MGVNKFELFGQYLGRASNGDGSLPYQRVTLAMAQKAILDAKNLSLPFFRVSVTGFAPSEHGRDGDLELWRRDPAAFWRLMDDMMADLDTSGIRLVPVILWNPLQFPAMSGETVAQLIVDPHSKSWHLLSSFTAEFVRRYLGRRTVLFYELTNELNLWADLDHVKRCRQRRGPARDCAVMGNFTTEQLIEFSGRFANLVRNLDRGRQVSSGFSLPRAAASHLQVRPEWSRQGADWMPDSREMFVRHLLDLHRHMDIVSVHLYDAPENIRFGLPDAAALLDVIKDASDSVDKPLFVGEFGDGSSKAPEAQSHSARLLKRSVTRRVPYSAYWAWQFYQTSPYETRNSEATASSIEPGAGNWLIDRLQEANAALGNRQPQPEFPDRQVPQVVLTWPLACALLQPRQYLHAVASDNAGAVRQVEFLVNGKLIAADDTYPFASEIDASRLPPGMHTISARALDQAGNVAEYRARVFSGRVGRGSQCLVD